jgi:hypothetical protein
MNRQEQHHQKKEKEREQKNKAEKAYDEAAQESRLPVRNVWLIVVGTVLTALVIYAWTVGIW